MDVAMTISVGVWLANSCSPSIETFMAACSLVLDNSTAIIEHDLANNVFR